MSQRSVVKSDLVLQAQGEHGPFCVSNADEGKIKRLIVALYLANRHVVLEKNGKGERKVDAIIDACL